MQSFLDGISWGLFLSMLIGPIFFALIQAGIEKGVKAGLILGLGIWMSDLLFVSIIYNGISSVIGLTEWSGFKPTIGILGGIILIGFGIGSLLSRPTPLSIKLSNKEPDPTLRSVKTPYSALWLKGFLVNTVNPFTVLFWIGLLSTLSTRPDFENTNVLLFFCGLLGMIVLTDSLKVFLAKYIRQWMTINHILWIRRISGSAFLIFGVAMIIRVLFFEG